MDGTSIAYTTIRHQSHAVVLVILVWEITSAMVLEVHIHMAPDVRTSLQTPPRVEMADFNSLHRLLSGMHGRDS
jgi:hypothetical protein